MAGLLYSQSPPYHTETAHLLLDARFALGPRKRGDPTLLSARVYQG